MDWHTIESAPKDRPVLLFQDGHYSVGQWCDTSHQEQQLVSKRGNRETYEWVDVVHGYWTANGDIYAPTHWCELTAPAEEEGRR